MGAKVLTVVYTIPWYTELWYKGSTLYAQT
jgi:hypothetical protein